MITQNTLNVKANNEIEVDDMPASDLHIDQYRANIYGVLSHIYRYEISEDFMRDVLNSDLISKMIEDMNISEVDLELNDIEKLSVEYTRLFIGPMSHVSPFASVYFDTGKKTGQMWGKITGEIKRYVEFYGLSVSDKIIPDHISILFEFMERVIRSKISISRSNQDRALRREQRNKADEIQKEFFLKYIDPWVDTFFEKILNYNPHLFYESVVKFNKKFIDIERELFAKK